MFQRILCGVPTIAIGHLPVHYYGECEKEAAGLSPLFTENTIIWPTFIIDCVTHLVSMEAEDPIIVNCPCHFIMSYTFILGAPEFWLLFYISLWAGFHFSSVIFQHILLYVNRVITYWQTAVAFTLSLTSHIPTSTSIIKHFRSSCSLPKLV